MYVYYLLVAFATNRALKQNRQLREPLWRCTRDKYDNMGYLSCIIILVCEQGLKIMLNIGDESSVKAFLIQVSCRSILWSMASLCHSSST